MGPFLKCLGFFNYWVAYLANDDPFIAFGVNILDTLLFWERPLCGVWVNGEALDRVIIPFGADMASQPFRCI